MFFATNETSSESCNQLVLCSAFCWQSPMGPALFPCDLPGASATKGPARCAAIIFERRELAFLFLTLSHHFYAPSVAYDRTFPTFCRSCCNHDRPTQPIRYAATAVFSAITIKRKPFFIQITYDSQTQQRKYLYLTSTQSCQWPQVVQYQGASSCRTV